MAVEMIGDMNLLHCSITPCNDVIIPEVIFLPGTKALTSFLNTWLEKYNVWSSG